MFDGHLLDIENIGTADAFGIQVVPVAVAVL